MSWPLQLCPLLPCFPTTSDDCVEMWPSESRSMRMRLLHVFHSQPRHWGNPVNNLLWSKQTMWNFHDMTTSPCNLMKFPIQFCHHFFSYKAARARGIEEKQTSDTTWIGTFPRPRLMNLSALSHITSTVPNTQRIWTLVYVKFQAASWQFAPETARMQPQQPTPKHNLQRTSKHKIAKKVLRGSWFQVISGNAPQMTETAWQRTSKYESSVQSPPQTTIWQLATHLKLQNAPQITLPFALPTCNWNEDLGKKRWERGTPPPPKKMKGGKTGNQKNCEPILI